MVTGDFSITATAIAKQCGIITVNKVDNASVVRDPSTVPTIRDEDDEETYHNNNVTALVISGSDLMEGFSDHEWDVICSYSEIVFARTTPEQKLRIVNGKLSMPPEWQLYALVLTFLSLQSRNACSWCYRWCHW
jgi:sodium/potassium-transporting ATPase subunit alpha